MNDYLFWVILIALAVVPSYLFKRKFKIETHGPICLWRTKRGLQFLKNISGHSFWTYLADAGMIFCFGVFGALYLFLSSGKKKPYAKILVSYLLFLLSCILIIEPMLLFGYGVSRFDYLSVLFVGGFGLFALYILIEYAVLIIMNYMVGITPVPMIQPVIPAVDIPGAPIKVPLSAVVGLVILIVVHEISHGIVAIKEKIKVLSMGLITIGIFPIGAFTEPDEKQLKRVAMKKRLRVFSAGSMANFVTGFIFLAVFVPAQMIAAPIMLSSSYLEITEVDDGSPAALVGITPGIKIQDFEFLEERNRTPGSVVNLITDKGNFSIKTNETGKIGITFDPTPKLRSGDIGVQFLFYSLEILSWTAILNFAVGMFNFLPFAIFDGARILEDLVNFYAKKLGIKKKKIGKNAVLFVSLFIAALLIINILPYFVK